MGELPPNVNFSCRADCRADCQFGSPSGIGLGTAFSRRRALQVSGMGPRSSSLILVKIEPWHGRQERAGTLQPLDFPSVSAALQNCSSVSCRYRFHEGDVGGGGAREFSGGGQVGTEHSPSFLRWLASTAGNGWLVDSRTASARRMISAPFPIAWANGSRCSP